MKKNEILRGMSLARQTQDILNFQKFVPRPIDINFTLPTNLWTLNSSATDEYIYYADINISGVTADDEAEIDFDKQLKDMVIYAGISSEGESLSDNLRIFAKKIPLQELTGVARITKGVSSS